MSNEKLLINDPKSNNSEDMSNKQIEEMAKCCIYHKDGMCVIDKDISYCDLMCKMFGFITNLYTAGYHKQSEGEWKDKDKNGISIHGFMVCSVCDVMIPTCDENRYCLSHLHFCPYCGAKMKGGAE